MRTSAGSLSTASTPAQTTGSSTTILMVSTGLSGTPSPAAATNASVSTTTGAGAISSTVAGIDLSNDIVQTVGLEIAESLKD